MAPIRSGVGLRLGANIGYIRFTPKADLEPVLIGCGAAGHVNQPSPWSDPYLPDYPGLPGKQTITKENDP